MQRRSKHDSVLPPWKDTSHELRSWFRCEHNDPLQGWSHEAVSSFRSMWALSSVPKLKDFLYAVTDDTKRALATHVIEGFETEIVPKANTFRKGG